MIDLSDVSFRWAKDGFGLSVSDFHVESGESVFLLGHSGSGKSTLLSLICGIVTPQRGRIDVAGQDISALPSRKRDSYRADKIGIIFQMFNLLPYASALDNILVPLRFSSERRSRCPEPRQEAMTLTGSLGLPDQIVTNGTASKLSIGQQQRVAVARALIGRPPILIADEPTSALDASAQEEFLGLVFDRVRADGTTFVMVSHDIRLAERFDRVVNLEDIATTYRGVGA